MKVLFSPFIIGYLFLAGLGSGAYVVSTIFALHDAHKQTAESQTLIDRAQLGFIIAPLAMITGLAFLLLDLGVIERFWLLLISPLNNIVTIGTWIVVIFTIISAILVMCGLLMKLIPKLLLWFSWIVDGVFAIATMTYTGILLSNMASIDIWNTWLLVALFLLSSLSTGAAAIIVTDAIINNKKPVSITLWGASAAFGIIEAIILIAYILERYNFSETAQLSCEMLLMGSSSPQFWIFVVGIGLVLPLALQVLFRKEPIPLLVPVAALGTLVGGIALRYCIIEIAKYSPLGFGTVL